MTLLNKPIYTQDDIWGMEGARTLPPTEKIKKGWGQEMMPAEYENWIQNRQDHALAYLYQRGIPEWDSLTPYYQNKSIVQIEGNIWLCTQDHTNKPPILSNEDYWRRLVDASGNIVIRTSKTGQAVIPSGTTAQRDPDALSGHFRFNTTIQRLEYFDGTNWVKINTADELAALILRAENAATAAEASAITSAQKASEAATSALNAMNALNIAAQTGVSYDVQVFDKAPSGVIGKVFPGVALKSQVGFNGFAVDAVGASDLELEVLHNTTVVYTYKNSAWVLVAPHDIAETDSITVRVSAGSATQITLNLRWSLLTWATI